MDLRHFYRGYLFGLLFDPPPHASKPLPRPPEASVADLCLRQGLCVLGGLALERAGYSDRHWAAGGYKERRKASESLEKNSMKIRKKN